MAVFSGARTGTNANSHGIYGAKPYGRMRLPGKHDDLLRALSLLEVGCSVRFPLVASFVDQVVPAAGDRARETVVERTVLLLQCTPGNQMAEKIMRIHAFRQLPGPVIILARMSLNAIEHFGRCPSAVRNIPHDRRRQLAGEDHRIAAALAVA